MKHDLKNRVKGSMRTLLGTAVVALAIAGCIYLSYSWQMVSYKIYTACNPASGIGQIEWFFGVRPTPNSCWPQISN